MQETGLFFLSQNNTAQKAIISLQEIKRMLASRNAAKAHTRRTSTCTNSSKRSCRSRNNSRRGSTTSKRGGHVNLLGKSTAVKNTGTSSTDEVVRLRQQLQKLTDELMTLKEQVNHRNELDDGHDGGDQKNSRRDGSGKSHVSFPSINIPTVDEDDTSMSSDVSFASSVFSKAEPILDSFDSYIVVSVLTATASFAALFEASSDHTDHDDLGTELLKILFVLTCSISSLSGMYATVVFSFSSIYGRTACGTGQADVYEEFLTNTGTIRYRAFLMYMLSLVSFMALLVATATQRIDPLYRYPFALFLIVLSGLSLNDWNQVIKAASLIFKNDDDDDDENDDNNRQDVARLLKKRRQEAGTLLSKTKSKKLL